MTHRYLFTLEIVPLEVGKIYDELPSHLTLMSRFLSKLPAGELADMVRSLFNQSGHIDITFRGTSQLGPKQVTVHVVVPSEPLTGLHSNLYRALEEADVTFEYPQYIGRNHKPHVTTRQGIWFQEGQVQRARAAYLIEIVHTQRLVRSRLELGGSTQNEVPTGQE